MHKIQIPIGTEGDATEAQFKDFCKYFSCTLQKKKRGDTDWVITSDDVNDFFWLGANLTLRRKDGIAISVASKMLGDK